MVEANKFGISEEFKRLGMYYSAQLVDNNSNKDNNDVTLMDYSTAWKQNISWGKISWYNKSLYQNHEYHLWRAIQYNESESLKTFSNNCFNSLKKGMEEEMTREDINRLMIDCLIVDFIHNQMDGNKMETNDVDWIDDCNIDYKIVEKLYDICRIYGINDVNYKQCKYARKYGYFNEAFLVLMRSQERDDSWIEELAKIKYKQGNISE